MNCTIFIRAHYGDFGGGIIEVSIKTDVRLTNENLPDLSKAEQDLDACPSESWANIGLEKEDYIYEDYSLRNKKLPDETINSRLGILFFTEYGSLFIMKADWEQLSNCLLEIVNSNNYIETIYHVNGSSKTEYVYSLPPSIFVKE